VTTPTFAKTAEIAPDQRVAMISDMHVGDGGASEPFRRQDDVLRAFFEHVARDYDALVIAGDGFDLAQAWSMRRIYERHRPLLDDLRDLSRELPVYYLRGNHDESASQLAEVLPLRYSENLRIGERILVEHGNVFDPKNQPGDRAAFWASRTHAMIEKALRSPVRIPMRKHYCWSTRLGHWVFFRYGMLQKLMSRLYGALGLEERARECLAFLDYWGRGEWGNLNGVLDAGEALLRGSAYDVLVCGHTHQPGQVRLSSGTYVNTGSWTFGETTYVDYAGGEFNVRRWPEAGALADEEYRGVLGPHSDKSFFEWWEAFYLGWLRYDVEAMDRAALGDPLREAGEDAR